MKKTLVIHIPGLSAEVAARLLASGDVGHHLTQYKTLDFDPPWPAVTCTVQASLTTGLTPNDHGMIANGLPTYLSEADQDQTDPANHVGHRRRVSFWEQSNTLLDQPRFWSAIKAKTAMLFFQQSMPGWSGQPRPAADLVITPKPEHGPDGRLTSLLWSNQPELLTTLQRSLGPFPLHHYWGPMAGLPSSRWIAAATLQVLQWAEPYDLVLSYLPHLDYDFQRFGPQSPQAANAVSELAVLLAGIFAAGYQPILVGEYGIAPVHQSVAPNRLLLEAGLLTLKDRAIDYHNSPAWAMCDHQAAHIYVRDPKWLSQADEILRASKLLEPTEGRTIRHRRAGQLQYQAVEGAWCDYRWWIRAEDAPTFAQTVDIHSKPGYDPLELFFAAPPVAGQIPGPPKITDDATKIKGSHGRTDSNWYLEPKSPNRPVVLWPTSLPSTDGVETHPFDYCQRLQAALRSAND
jgi:Type I phosphodiesterase / nucleotide pyrophosphatase